MYIAFEGGSRSYKAAAQFSSHLLDHLYSTGEKVVVLFGEMIANALYHRRSGFIFGE